MINVSYGGGPRLALGRVVETAERYGRRVDREEQLAKPELLDLGGAYHHWVCDGSVVAVHFGELVEWYESQVDMLSAVWQRQVVLSPYAESAVTVKVYGEGDSQGAHYDTNPLTVLGYLADSTAATVFQAGHGETDHLRVAPRAGAVVSFLGREHLHWVEPVPAGERRVSVSYNYYFDDDLWRPDGIDDLIYGEKRT